MASPPTEDESTVDTTLGIFDKLPALARFILIVGFPTLVALVYMGQDAGVIPSHLKTLSEGQQAMAANLEQHRKRQEDLMQTIKTGLRILCENEAKQAFQFNNCKNIQ